MSDPELSSKIDTVYDDPQTGDRIVFGGFSGMTYERTVVKKGDVIAYKEDDRTETLEQFRSRIIERVEFIRAIRLAVREV